MSAIQNSHDAQYLNKRRPHGSPLGYSYTSKTMLNGKPMTNGRRSPKGKPDRPSKGGAKESINLKTVERIDSGVNSILRTVSCVMVYEYLEDSETWERTSMEGTLFVYGRRDPGPSHAFLILSKLANDHLLVHLEEGMMVHTQFPFVLFRKSIKDKVYGLNFSDEATCLDIGDVLLRLCQRMRPVSPSTDNNKQQSSLSVDRHHLTPSPSFSDHSGEGDSQEEGVGSDSQQPIPEHHSIYQRQETARKQRVGMGRRTSEPIFVSTDKSRTKRETSPLSIRSSSKSYPKSPAQFQMQNSVATPKSVSSGGGKAREKGLVNQRRFHSASVDAGVKYQPLSNSPSLAKKLFQEEHTDYPDQTPAVLHHLFAQASSHPPISLATSYVNSVPAPPPPPLQKVVSLAEIEEQMNSDVLGDQNVSSVQTSSTADPPFRLLQPSVFSTSNKIENIPPNGQAIQASSETNTSAYLEVDIQVQPPTPVSISNGVPLLATIFPSIPSLVHSPGMRSQPITVGNLAPSIYQCADESTQSNEAKKQTYFISSDALPITRSLSDTTVKSSDVPPTTRSSSDVTPTTRSSSDATPTTRSSSDALPTTTPSNLITPVYFSSPAQRSTSEPIKEAAIGLTKEQLQQALLYLIKNDSSFISTLHEAYISSLKSSTR